MMLGRLFLSACVLVFSLQLYSHEIVIQPDWWAGDKCLENGVPWQVPGSVYEEELHIKKDDVALELGTGGSTIFLALRCKKVIAIETNQDWAKAVRKRLDALKLTNVDLICISNQRDIEVYLKNLNTEVVNIISVDTVFGYNRSAFLSEVLKKGISPNLHMIVLDNYEDRGLFPDHFNREAVDLNQWEALRFNDPHSLGTGTKLYIRK